jgi:hypothetical protein
VRALTLVAPLALMTALAAAAPAQSPTLPDKGLAWTLPPGWHDVAQQLTGLADPAQQLAAATFELRQTRPDEGCSLETARRQLPPDGVLVTLLESRDAAGVPSRLRKFPPRPSHFRLRKRDVRPYECLGRGINVPFHTQERAFYAMALVGARAPRSRLAEAAALLDSLAIQKIPPPPPPARWPTISTEAGDGLSVPFGWRSASLAVPRRLARPRLLFWTANQRLPQHPSGHRPGLGDAALPPRLNDDGVAVWIVEHRRGADPALPTPPGANYTVRTRSLVDHGNRFSISILAGPTARPADLTKAEAAANSLGISSVGRQCHATAKRRRPDLCAGTAQRLFSQPPYLGVSCRRPNVTTCDRIGVAVWLRRPARRITARVNGRRLTLDDPNWGNTQDPRGPLYVGFLQPAGLTDAGGPLDVPEHWEGVPARSAWLDLDIDGQKTGLVVQLHAGWG